jgi:hypothetical protein
VACSLARRPAPVDFVPRALFSPRLKDDNDIIATVNTRPVPVEWVVRPLHEMQQSPQYVLGEEVMR